MIFFTRCIFFFLAFLLPFGSANPFNLSVLADVDGQMGEQMGISPVVFAVACICAVSDKKIFKHYSRIKTFILPIVLFYLSLVVASLFYFAPGISFPIVYLLKLIAVLAGFFIVSLYFIEYPQTLQISMAIYAYTCVAVILAFFAGPLQEYSYVSGGRLWIFGQNPNSFSFLMSLGAVFLASKFNTDNKTPKIVKGVDAIGIISLLLYIILSGSRGTFLIVILCLALLLLKKIVKNIWLTAPLILCVAWGGFYYYINHEDEISIFTRLSNTDDDERLTLQKHTIDIFFEYPLLGCGVDGYKNEMRKRFGEERDSHNVIVSTLGMSGLCGGASFVTFLFLLGSYSWKRKSHNILPIVLFIQTLLMSMKTGSVLPYTMMWYTYAMTVALASNKIQGK